MARKANDTDLLASFGERLRDLRLGAGMTQHDLAVGADLHRTYVGRLERGLVSPTLDTLVNLADALGVDAARLVEGLSGADEAD